MKEGQGGQQYIQLLSLPEGVQVSRNGSTKYYRYDQITDASRRRLWNVMDKCRQRVSNPDIHLWRGEIISESPHQTGASE